MIGCFWTRVRKQPIIALYFLLKDALYQYFQEPADNQSLSFFLSLLVRSYMSITPGSANLEILIKIKIQKQHNKQNNTKNTTTFGWIFVLIRSALNSSVDWIFATEGGRLFQCGIVRGGGKNSVWNGRGDSKTKNLGRHSNLFGKGFIHTCLGKRVVNFLNNENGNKVKDNTSNEKKVMGAD